MRTIYACVVALVFAAPVSAQAVGPKNPTSATFSSIDHAAVTGYEIDIIASAGAVVQTLSLGKGVLAPAGACGVTTDPCVTLTMNVQPIAFGTYTIRVRAIAAAVKSADSPTSDPW